MKKYFTLGMLIALTLTVGCSSHHKGPAYGHEQEFRQQVEASIPVQKWGYKIQDICFTDDFEKALVVFDTAAGKSQEVIFEDDGFRRYHGNVADLDRQMANSITNMPDWFQSIKVTLPDK
jgi:major membrane immunogen (membrane-anchored lipoprotein)